MRAEITDVIDTQEYMPCTIRSRLAVRRDVEIILKRRFHEHEVRVDSGSYKNLSFSNSCNYVYI